MRLPILILLFLLILARPATAQFWMNQTRFDPRENSALVHWWDGSFGVSGTITIADQVRNGKNLSAASHQPTLVATSQNGWSCVHFTNSQWIGTADSSWMLIGQNYHFFWTGRASNPTAAQMIADSATNHQVFSMTTGSVLDQNDGAQLRQSSTSPTVSSYSQLEISGATGVPTFKQNGTDLGRSGTGVMSASFAYNNLGNVLGAAFLNGDMLITLHYSAAQSGNSYNKITNYIGRRFNL